MISELMHKTREDPYLCYLKEKLSKEKISDFVKKGTVDDASQEDCLELSNSVVQNWRLHNNYGAIFTIHTLEDHYFPHMDKLIEGIMDERYLRRKSNFNLEDPYDKCLSKKAILQKMLGDNSIAAFSVKGNDLEKSNNKICVDYFVSFNSNTRITVLTEGEGPFAAEISNYSCRRIVELFNDKYKLESKVYDVEVIMKHALEELNQDLLTEDPSRPFDTVLTGVAGKMAIDK